MSRTSFIAAILGISLLAGAVSAKAPNRNEIDSYPPGFTSDRKGGYVYVAPSVQAVPPVVSYSYAVPYAYGNGRYGGGYLPPPIGFGSPYYNGYNDPNYRQYGPGVREFIRYGGADFYGW